MDSIRAVEVENHREHQWDINTPGGAYAQLTFGIQKPITIEKKMRKQCSGAVEGKPNEAAPLIVFGGG